MIKEFLKNKGWIATILGMMIGFPVGISIIFRYFRNPEFTNQELITTVVLLGIAMLWVILPSRIEFTTGKISLRMED